MCDHVDVLDYLQNTKSRKLRKMAELFGIAETKKIVADTLKKHNAVRGMAGFVKRAG